MPSPGSPSMVLRQCCGRQTQTSFTHKSVCRIVKLQGKQGVKSVATYRERLDLSTLYLRTIWAHGSAGASTTTAALVP